MKLSKKEELLALGSALYLMGIEMESAKSKLEELVQQAEDAGQALEPTQELLGSLQAYNNAKEKFTRLEQRYLQLQKEI